MAVRRWIVPAVLLALTAACASDGAPTSPPPPDPAPKPLLRDMVVDHLPSPYYHFEYDTSGRANRASFASDFFVYDLVYSGGRLTEMRNNILVNHDRLVYAYDGAGRVATVTYVDDGGTEFARVHLTYSGRQLVTLERERLVQGAFVMDKTMSFTYDASGNLFELTQHFPAVGQVQTEATVTDRYEHYDTGINVDGFGLLHSEFFDHVVLLPDVQLQRGNPGTETRTGDGDNYRVEYTYTYDDQHRPLTKNGDIVLSNGPNAGQHFPSSTVYSYY